jgi:chorismate mutase
MAEERVTGTTTDALRTRIDEIDRALVALLSERARCAMAIGQIKRETGQAIYQPAREADVLANVRAANPGPLDDAALTRLFERIIDEHRRLERTGGAPGHRSDDGPGQYNQ